MHFSVECRGLAKSMAKLHRKFCRTEGLPEDVKEGQFAVCAIDHNGMLHRFVVGLDCLSHPEFLRLLELAANEFGLKQEGILMVPCEPCDLRKILREQQKLQKP